MGLRAVRLVMLCFMVIFLFGLYQTTLKLPSGRLPSEYYAISQTFDSNESLHTSAAEGESEGVLLYR